MNGYVLTQSALNDVSEILRFVAEQDGVSAALHVQTGLIKAFDMLVSAPRAGRPLRHSPAPLRQWRVFDYIDVYDAQTDPLVVIRVLHGARDLRSLLADL